MRLIQRLSGRRNATKIGKAIRAWTRTPKARDILAPLRRPFSGGPLESWASGGCEIMSAALMQVLPGAELVGVYAEHEYLEEEDGISHYGVLYEGRILDGLGSFADFEAWLNAHVCEAGGDMCWAINESPWRGADPRLTHRYGDFAFFQVRPAAEDAAAGRAAGILCPEESVRVAAESIRRFLQDRGLL